MVKRDRYLRELQQVIGKPVIKVMLGMRRVGKSTLLLQIQEMLCERGISREQIISLNFEWMEYEPIRNARALYAHIKRLMINKDRYYIFLDEVQEVDDFEKVVNSLNAEGQADLYITGSNARLLSGELATLMTGRFYTMEIMPLSFREMYGKTDKNEMQEQLMRYLTLGGMPGILQFDETRIARNYLMDLYQSILLRDIVKRHNIRDVDLLQRFMMFLLHNVGNTFSAGTIAAYLKNEGRKLSRETIYHYVEAAKSAYLIHSIPRYNIKGKELLKTNEKYFVNDLGIRSLYFDNQQDIGQAMENLVYLELRRRFDIIHVGKMDDKEVDFIVINGAERIYVQVAYLLSDSSTMDREFSVLEAIEDNHPKWVISLDPVNRSRNGIRHMHLLQFLMEEDP